MASDDVEYYERRAEQEIELAQRSDHAGAVSAHYQLASAYLDLIHGDSPKARPNLLQS
ncbi:MAG TPA: hypothetical protein VF704_00025 [Allosphingosinicella sp.]|jgi:hypothetical protein